MVRKIRAIIVGIMFIALLGLLSGFRLPNPNAASTVFEGQPILISTAIIGFVDGFNPCSLWILSVLIGLVMRSGRNKVLIVGGTFLAVTGTIYGFFVAGIFTAMDIIAHLDVVRYVVAVFAIGFAVVSIKDYFFFGEGVSFTIPDRVKPDVYRGLREAVQTDGTLSTIFATGVMAGGVALVELPCTSGFPVVWSNLVTVHDPSMGVFGALVLVYILLYLAVEIVIIGVAWYSMDRVTYSETHGRLLKLFAGVVLLGLGIAMVIRPEILENVRETVILFLGAVIFSGLIVWAESVVRENSVV